MRPAAGTSYRVAPHDVAGIVRAVEQEPISRGAVSKAFSTALEAIRNTDDQQVDAVIYALSGIDGDLRDAPECIDARIATVVDAARSVVDVVATGDAEIAQQVAGASGTAFDPRRFGAR